VADWLSNLGEQVNALPPARRWALAASAAASLAFFSWIALGMNEPDYRLLYRGFEEDEAARVLEVLRAEKIPYRLEEGGGTIYVPAPLVYETRIRVAGKGLPSGGSPGLEIFDKPGFGVSEFVNRVNYQRALQGELARSIEHLESVDRARVTVAIPKRRKFVSGRSEKPSASVVVRLHPGAELDAQQVSGIVHMVASSIQGLDPKDVTLVDRDGRMLAPEHASAMGGGTVSTGSLAHQAGLERELAERIESILAPTVGRGGVVAQVRARLDWTRTESTEERFDPDSQVARSEQRSTEASSEGSSNAAGIPGIASNAPAGIGGSGSVGSGSSENLSAETINYEINKVVSRTIAPMGRIERLDVAVLIDAGSGPAEGSWDAAALQEFEELAKRAIGFSSERGDEIAVRTAPFRAAPVEFVDEGFLGPEMILLVSTVLRFVGILAALVLFARLVLRPIIGRMADAPAALPVRAGELELQLAGAGADVALAEGASADAPVPPQIANEQNMQALRNWLKE
jgi:flagellar M-ring protein FliF